MEVSFSSLSTSLQSCCNSFSRPKKYPPSTTEMIRKETKFSIINNTCNSFSHLENAFLFSDSVCFSGAFLPLRRINMRNNPRWSNVELFQLYKFYVCDSPKIFFFSRLLMPAICHVLVQTTCGVMHPPQDARTRTWEMDMDGPRDVHEA